MRRNMYSRLIVTGALLGALVPVTALAQQMPGTPAAATDPTTIISNLPGPMGTVLSADLQQLKGAQGQGDIANAMQIFQTALAADLATAETNLQNDSSLNAGSTTADLPQAVAADQQLVSELTTLDQVVVASEASATTP